jgi:hypothetical protein
MVVKPCSQSAMFFLAQPDDAKEIVFLEVNDDVSAISTTSSSSAPIADDDINKNNHDQGNPMMKQKRNKVVSFRLSEPEYARYLSTAKICHDKPLPKALTLYRSYIFQWSASGTTSSIPKHKGSLLWKRRRKKIGNSHKRNKKGAWSGSRILIIME